MQKLSDSLLAADNFPLVTDHCKQIVLSEVQQKNLAIRSAFKLVQRAKPNLVERAIQVLLPDFAHALDPLYAEFERSPESSFTAFAAIHQERIAGELLAVTDQRVASVGNRAIRSAYRKLRGRAANEVINALPRIAGVVETYGQSCASPVPATAG